jgi:uncharacterized membrane protein (UPF0127 family)
VFRRTLLTAIAAVGLLAAAGEAAATGRAAALLVDGKRHLQLWVVTTPAGRAAGVNGHPLRPGEAMWFGWTSDTTSAFWMQGVRAPLVLVWVGSDRRVIGLRRMAPCPTGPGCPVYSPPRPYRFAIELRPADLARSKLRVGARVAIGRA